MRGICKPYEETHKIIDGNEFKHCSDCEKWILLTVDYYYKNKTAPDGFNPYCKVCTKKRSSKWQRDNPQEYKILKKKYNSKPESLEKNRIRNQKWRDKGGLREWYYNNPETLEGYQQRRESKKHEISKKEWRDCKDYFGNCCAYCGMPYEIHKQLYKKDLNRDHVDPKGSNKLDNCIPACIPCNVRKGDKKIDEWYNENNIIFDNGNLEEINKWLLEVYKLYIK